jgi:hypothetical protein
VNREIVLIVITSVNLVFILFGFGESPVSYHLLSNRLLLALCVMWDRLWGEQDMRFLESRIHVEILICFKSWADKFLSLLIQTYGCHLHLMLFKFWILQLRHFWDGDDYSYCTYRSTMLENLVVVFLVEMIEIAVFQNDRTKSNLLLSRNSQCTRPNIDESSLLLQACWNACYSSCS